MPSNVNVLTGDFNVISQKIASDHKTLELMLDALPVTGDIIYVDEVRNITNSFADDAYMTPVYAQPKTIGFDGTNWNFAPY